MPSQESECQSRWAKELKLWLDRRADDLDDYQDNLTLRIIVRDGVLYQVYTEMREERGRHNAMYFS